MDASKDQRAALLEVFDRLSEKDREWILAVARRVAKSKEKQEAWNRYLAGEITSDELCKIAEGVE